MIVSKAVSDYLKVLTERFVKNPGDQLFDTVIAPSVSNRGFPSVFLWSPVLQYDLNLFCPLHGCNLGLSVWIIYSIKDRNAIPKLIYRREFNILLIQQMHICSLLGHRYYSASDEIMRFSQAAEFRNEFPFPMYHKTVYTNDLIEHKFLQVIQWVSFHQISEGLEKCYKSRYISIQKWSSLFYPNRLEY